jgi:predicted O-methyltransferase YrrM
LVVHRFGIGTDALSPTVKGETGLPSDFGVLGSLVSDAEVGIWSLGSASLRYLDTVIRSDGPGAILEFGSGLSTLVMAQALAEATPNAGVPRLVSLEQDVREAERTGRLLADAGLAEHVALIHARLRPGVVNGKDISAYDIDPATLAELVSGPFDLVVIDGPSAEAGSRVSTLLTTTSIMRPGAMVIMDDALRDGELWAAKVWAESSHVHVLGIELLEKGLLVARMRGTDTVRGRAARC